MATTKEQFHALIKEEQDKLVAKYSDTIMLIKQQLNLSFGRDNNQIQKIDQEEFLTKKLFGRSEEKEYANAIRVNMAYNFYRVIVLFPEIEINNRAGNKHTIKDLYVIFTMTAECKLTGVLTGMRGKFSVAEWTSDYAHSHLRGIARMQDTDGTVKHTPSGFCTGSGPINGHRAALVKNFDVKAFKVFCLSLRTYVRYESTEGTPFRRMRSIMNNGSITTLRDAGYYAEEGVNAIIGYLTHINLQDYVTVKLVGSEVTVSMDSTQHEALSKKMLADLREAESDNLKTFGGSMPFVKNLLAYKQSDDSFVSYREGSTGINVPMDGKYPTTLVFKNQPVVAQIETSTVQTLPTEYVNPNVINAALRRISIQIRQEIVKSQRAAKERHSKDKSEVTEPDHVAVS